MDQAPSCLLPQGNESTIYFKLGDKNSARRHGGYYFKRTGEKKGLTSLCDAEHAEPAWTCSSKEVISWPFFFGLLLKGSTKTATTSFNLFTA